MPEQTFLSVPTSLVSLRDSVVLTARKSRMGGQILHVKTPWGAEAFIKSGSGLERLELLREHRNLRTFGAFLAVPAVIDFYDSGLEAHLALSRLPGRPLHELCPDLGRRNTLSLLANILFTLWDPAEASHRGLRDCVEEELNDVRSLLHQNLIDEAAFLESSGGDSPQSTYEKVRAKLLTHEKNVVSHGDFCLPNILVDENGRWGLLDVGKGGAGDRYRDLSSIDVSLARNIDADAYGELLHILGIDDREGTDRKTQPYKTIDLFWYNAHL